MGPSNRAPPARQLPHAPAHRPTQDGTSNTKKTPNTPWLAVAGRASWRGAYLTDAEVAELSDDEQLAKALEISARLQRPERLKSKYPRALNENSNCYVSSFLHVFFGTKGVRNLILADPADAQCEASPLFRALRDAFTVYRETFRAWRPPPSAPRG